MRSPRPLLSFLATSLGFGRSRDRRAARSGGFRPALEALEDRNLLSTLTVVNTNDDGLGSLRDTISHAFRGDTIQFQPGLGSTIKLTSGDLEIGTNLTITGPGAGRLTISGESSSEVFKIDFTATVSLSGLTIADGKAAEGGGIKNDGTLTLTDCTLSSNTATDSGGGVWNDGALTVTDCTLTGNTATNHGGGIDNDQTLTVGDSTVRDNSAGSDGGGIYNEPGAQATLISSTLAYNSTTNVLGGGGGLTNLGKMSVDNSTLAHNSTNNVGGGIFNVSFLTVTNCTIAYNSAPGINSISDGSYGLGGGIAISDGATLTIGNTIVAANSGRVPDVVGVVGSEGSNLVGDFSGSEGFIHADHVGTSTHPLDPKLGPLQANFGPTETVALLPASPAINAGNNALLVDAFSGFPFTTDQRGAGRIAGGRVDIGAYELHLDTVLNNQDSSAGSLRGVVAAAADGDTIVFDPGLQGQTIALHSTLEFPKSVSILGPGADLLTVSGSDAGTVFKFGSGFTGVISGLTIAHGNANKGGGIDNNGRLIIRDCTLANNSGTFDGGGIYSDGTLTILDSTIANNSASDAGIADGGGIENAGSLTVSNSTIAHNTAGHDGGGIDNTGTLTISNSTITDNGAGDGGGIDNTGTLTVTTCTLADNGAGDGGGIANSGTATIADSTIARNTADFGAGIENQQSLAVSNSTIADNTAAGAGGGINNSGTLTIFSSTIAWNTAGELGGGINCGGKVTIGNTIVAANTVLDAPLDVSGAVSSLGSNLVGQPGDSFGWVGSDRLGTKGAPLDARLGPLEPNFGPTETVALLPGSPAIDAGQRSLAVDPSGVLLTTDQRGVSRVLGGAVDIGAYEFRLDTVTNNLDFGDGSLRVVLADAHNGDTINFDPGLIWTTITLYSALEVNKSVAFVGLGADMLTLSGNNTNGVIVIHAGTAVSITGLTIAQGNATQGGGIDNAGVLTVSNSAFTNNSAASKGGGIHNSGTLTLSNSTLDSNNANVGGGINNDGVLTVSNCTLTNDSATGGGGIFNRGGTLTVEATTLENDTATLGGGIYNTGTATVGGSTLAHDTATRNGGGIANFGTLTVDNSTLANNSAATGGGILNNVTLTISFSTLAENTATGIGGGITNNGTLTVGNTIMAANAAGADPDVFGTVASQGYNLVGETGDSSGWGTLDYTGTGAAPLDPLLGPLQDNGGPTETMALLPGSPAIGFTYDLSEGTDQRGLPRPIVGPLDIGAYETQQATVLNANDDGEGSLRATLEAAHDGDTIAFAAALKGKTITLTSGSLLLKSVSIVGPGADQLTVSGNGTCPVFSVSAGTSAVLSGLTIDSGKGSLDSGTDSLGGAIHNAGRLTVSNCTLSNSTSPDGGGIYNTGTLTILNSTFADNKATAPEGKGGAIDNESDGTVTVSASTFADNGAVDGGGIENFGTLAVGNSTFSANTAAHGGGLRNESGGTLTVGNTILAGNSAGTGADVDGAVISLGTNFVGQGEGSSGWGATDLVGSSAAPLDPHLGALQDNGGTTPTMALLPGNPVSGHGSSTLATLTASVKAGGTTLHVSDGSLFAVGQLIQSEHEWMRVVAVSGTTLTVERGVYPTAAGAHAGGAALLVVGDQRGMGRVVDGRVDIGAYEPQAATVVNGNDHGDGSLRGVIDSAHDGDTITFPSYLDGQTITLYSDTLVLKSITLIGPGSGQLTISGVPLRSVVSVAKGTTAIVSGLTFNNGGGFTGHGGGIDNEGTLTLDDVVVTGNSAGSGGGIWNTGTLTVSNSTISGNTVYDYTGSGGGIWNDGTLTLTDCTISGNTASGSASSGGGVMNEGEGTLTVTNCTFAANTADSGGGLANYGTATLGDSTLATNSATTVAGGIGNGGTLTVSNTILAANTAGTDPDAAGAFSSEGYNLVGQPGDSSGWVASDLVGSSTTPLDPKLGPLQGNGGPTYTMALSLDSPALDAGKNDLALDPTSGQPLTTDQRGKTRIVDGTIDIGAYEVQANAFPPKATPTVTWGNPADIVYGTALGDAQLDATASVPGTFTYTVTAGTVLHAGANQSLGVTFTPTDQRHYNSVKQSVTLNVNAAPLKITADNMTKVYGAALPALTARYSGLVNGETPAVFTAAGNTPPTLSTTATAASDVVTGGYRIIVGGAVDPDYTIVYVSGTLTVTPADAAISVKGYSGSYDGAAHALSGSATGAFGEDLSGLLRLGASSTDPGHYVVNWSFAGNRDYRSAGGTAAIDIARKPLIVQADDATKVYGSANPGFTASYSGFVPGQDAAVLGGSLVFTTAATPSSDVGGYDITPGGLTSADYAIGFLAGTLTVTPSDAGVSISGYNGTYDGAAHGLSGSAAGIFGEDLSSLLNLGTGYTDAGHYPVSWSFAGNSDYRSAGGTATIDITRAPLTVTVGNVTKTYGQTADFSALPATVTTGIGKETLAVTYASAGAAATADVVAGGYAITATLADARGKLANYNVTVTPGTLTVARAITQTTLSASAGSILPTQGLTLTATVAVQSALAAGSRLPTGSVVFRDGAASFSAAVNGKGVATLTFAAGALAPGKHSFTAAYAGDADFQASSASAAVGVQVASPAPPSAVLTGDTGGVRGQTLNVTVTARDPAGTSAFAVSWGDGRSTPVPASAAGTVTALGHVWTSSGIWTVRVTATDSNGHATVLATQVVTTTAVAIEPDPNNPGGSILAVGGTMGNDAILIASMPSGRPGDGMKVLGAGAGLLTVTQGGVCQIYSPAAGHSFSRILVFGQAGDDLLQVSPSVTVNAELHAGGGSDTLIGGGGSDTLIGGAGQDILRGGSNGSLLIAGSGNAVLVGGAGNDTLMGGGGRDLLIGGGGQDRLVAGSGDAILIGGSTAYDAKDAALLAILKEWSSGHDYTTRTNNILGPMPVQSNNVFGGRLNGSYLLSPSTVHDDAATDTLIGGPGSDWFFANLDPHDVNHDNVQGATGQEIMTDIRPGSGKPSA